VALYSPKPPTVEPAEDVVGRSAAQALEGFASMLVPGLPDEPAWPTLRTTSAPPRHGGRRSARACGPLRRQGDKQRRRPCSTAGLASGRHQPRFVTVSCRGCPAFPTRGPTPKGGHTCTPDHSWFGQLANQVRLNTAGEALAWAAQLHILVPAELIADVQVWRAATQVDPSDRRPTGRSLAAAESRWDGRRD
jgi:hypothetical protein